MSEQMAAWGEWPYDKRTVAEVVHDFAVVRGDLSEQYARDQLAAWVERYAAHVAAEAGRTVATIRAMAAADTGFREACAADPECSCSYKDCYECGKWHNCKHTPWTAIREVLTTPPPAPTEDVGGAGVGAEGVVGRG